MNESAQDEGISFAVSAAIDNVALNALYDVAWPRHTWWDFEPVLAHSFAWATAHAGDRLIGFVYLAWDGGVHSFLLEPTVHPDWRRRGIGSRLVELVVEAARSRGLEYVHVDFYPELRPFYAHCGFQPTEAGLIRLS